MTQATCGTRSSCSTTSSSASLAYVHAPRRFAGPRAVVLTTLSSNIFVFHAVSQGLLGTFFVVFNIKVNRIRKNSFLANWPVTEVLVLVLLSTLLQYPMKVSRYFPSTPDWCAHLRQR